VSIPQWQPPPGASPRRLRQWRKEMQDWIGGVLDWRTETKIESANEYWGHQGSKKYFEQSVVEDARHGNVETLRKLYPHIAHFIHLPREGHRGKYPRRSSGTITCVEDAIEASAFVRLFWREVYGRRNRSRDDAMSAEAVVAHYYKSMGLAEVTEDAIKQRARKYRIPPLVAARDAEMARSLASSISR
jgi:hypothetical protein